MSEQNPPNDPSPPYKRSKSFIRRMKDAGSLVLRRKTSGFKQRPKSVGDSTNSPMKPLSASVSSKKVGARSPRLTTPPQSPSAESESVVPSGRSSPTETESPATESVGSKKRPAPFAVTDVAACFTRDYVSYACEFSSGSDTWKARARPRAQRPPALEPRAAAARLQAPIRLCHTHPTPTAASSQVNRRFSEWRVLAEAAAAALPADTPPFPPRALNWVFEALNLLGAPQALDGLVGERAAAIDAWAKAVAHASHDDFEVRATLAAWIEKAPAGEAVEAAPAGKPCCSGCH